MKNLKHVTISENDGMHYTKGSNGVSAITLDATGLGPMGFYDVIAVDFDDGSKAELPAHNCLDWTIDQ